VLKLLNTYFIKKLPARFSVLQLYFKYLQEYYDYFSPPVKKYLPFLFNQVFNFLRRYRKVSIPNKIALIVNFFFTPLCDKV